MSQLPTPQQVHIDAPMTELSIKYTNGIYVHTLLAPIIDVKKQSNKVWRYSRHNMKRVDTMRAPGDKPRLIWSTRDTLTYFCTARAAMAKVTDDERDNADTPLDPMIEATELTTDAILEDSEIRFKESVDASISSVSAPSTKWDNNGNVDVDVLNAVVVMHQKIFRRPNKIVIPFEVAVKLTTNSVIKDMTKYVTNLLTIGDVIMLPKVLWGMEVIIPECGQITDDVSDLNDPSFAVTTSYIWGKDVYMFYVAKNAGLKSITFAAIFRWKQRQVKTKYDDMEESTYVWTQTFIDEKVLCPECGIRIPTVIA